MPKGLLIPGQLLSPPLAVQGVEPNVLTDDQVIRVEPLLETTELPAVNFTAGVKGARLTQAPVCGS